MENRQNLGGANVYDCYLFAYLKEHELERRAILDYATTKQYLSTFLSDTQALWLVWLGRSKEVLQESLAGHQAGRAKMLPLLRQIEETKQR